MLSKTFLKAATACGLFYGSVNAHMVIRSPVPYGSDSLNNSPLEPDGSDFPCKQRAGVYDITKMNNMEVGVPQELAFTGGASHGGGSCQVSVTMDKEPTKDSDWRVIHSIIGGCPTNDTGNISGDPNYKGAATFEFSIPKGMPNGQYTLAWTWFNKIGNREMYMNCAPITVSGGSDNDNALSSLPAMFVANVPADECTTTEGDDVEFPNPGSSVETGDKAVPGKPTGPKCGGSGSAPSYGSSSDSPAATQAPSYGSQSSSSEYAAPSQAIPTYSGVVKGLDDTVTATTLATVTASGYSTAAAQPTGTSQAYQAAASYSSASGGSGSGSNSTSSSGGCASGAVQCSSPGSVVCIGSSQWGLCNIDNCAVLRDLATGTSCSAGVVSKRHVSRHLRNHLSSHARKL